MFGFLFLTCVGAEDQQQRDNHAEDGDQVLFYCIRFGWFGNETKNIISFRDRRKIDRDARIKHTNRPDWCKGAKGVQTSSGWDGMGWDGSRGA